MKNAAFTLLLLTLAAFAAPASHAQAALVYVTPSGTSTGACTTGGVPNYTIAQAQLAANYGAGATQIGPDTTVLFCVGNQTVATNAVVFTEPSAGDGTSGHPITFTFDTGTVFASPQCSANGCLVINGDFVTVDGTNLTVENTLNGTTANAGATPGACLGGSCTVIASSSGITANGSNDIVKNVIVTHIFVHTALQNDCVGSAPTCQPNAGPAAPQCQSPAQCTIGEATTGINMAGPNGLAFNNTVDNAGSGIAGNNGVEISFNTVSRVNHGVVLGISAGLTWSNIKIHNNDVSDTFNWDEPDNQYHHDPFFIFSVASNSAIPGLLFYYNRVHGVLGNDPAYFTATGGSHVTAPFFFNDAGVTNKFSGWGIFRNVIDLDQSDTGCGGKTCNFPDDSYLFMTTCTLSGGCTPANNVLLANNTVIGLNGTTVINAGGYCWGYGDKSDTAVAMNNLCVTTAGATLTGGTGNYPFTVLVNYNMYPGTGTSNAFFVVAGNVNKWSVWSATPFFVDTSCNPTSTPPGTGSNCNPTLASMNISGTAPHTLGSGSAGIGAAKNLTGVTLGCVTFPALCTGAPTSFGAGSTNNGVADSASGNWNVGAYPAGSSGIVTVVPSTNSYLSVLPPGPSSDSPVTFTLTNNSGSTITFTGTSLTNSTDFTLGTNTCTGTLVTTGTCTVQVSFTPATSGAKSSTLNIAFTGASGSPVTSALSGTATAPNLNQGIALPPGSPW